MSKITASHLPPEAADAAQHSYELYHDMEAALLAALVEMGVKPEWAVPCLDKDDCRVQFAEREFAVRHAEKEGGVIETRLAQPWRVET